jgi:hypothetical protein
MSKVYKFHLGVPRFRVTEVRPVVDRKPMLCSEKEQDEEEASAQGQGVEQRIRMLNYQCGARGASVVILSRGWGGRKPSFALYFNIVVVRVGLVVD